MPNESLKSSTPRFLHETITVRTEGKGTVEITEAVHDLLRA